MSKFVIEGARRSSHRLAGCLLLVAACGRAEDAPLSFSADSGSGGVAGRAADGAGNGGALGVDVGGNSSAGAASTGGNSSAGASSTGGDGSAGAASAGADGSHGGADGSCSTGEQRCSPGGRESCQSGIWRPEPCPREAPSCQQGACIVRGPKLVKVTDFYIDSTEVTVAQYREFLAAVRNTPPKQIQYCSWNTSLLHSDSSVLMENPDMPIGSVNWCDATSYCEWADKHLCGNIDRQAKLAEKEFFNPQLSQWFLACGGPTSGMHPSISSCSPGIKPVATSACEGSYPGVFDLEGNVAEWIDGCRDTGHGDGSVDECFALGGAAEQPRMCTQVTSGFARGSSSFRWIGFRCCSG